MGRCSLLCSRLQNCCSAAELSRLNSMFTGCLCVLTGFWAIDAQQKNNNFRRTHALNTPNPASEAQICQGEVQTHESQDNHPSGFLQATAKSRRTLGCRRGLTRFVCQWLRWIKRYVAVPFIRRSTFISATFRNPRKVAGLKFAVLPDPPIRFLSRMTYLRMLKHIWFYNSVNITNTLY